MSSEKILIWMCNRVIWGFFSVRSRVNLFLLTKCVQKMLNFWMCYFFHEGKKRAFNVFSYRAELFFSLCGTVTVSFHGSHESHEKKNVQKIPFWIIFFVPCGDQREKKLFLTRKMCLFFLFFSENSFFPDKTVLCVKQSGTLYFLWENQ